MNPSVNSPILNRHDLSTLNRGLSAISDARAAVDRLKAAGVDVQDAEQQLKYLEQRYSQVKAIFFPQNG